MRGNAWDLGPLQLPWVVLHLEVLVAFRTFRNRSDCRVNGTNEKGDSARCKTTKSERLAVVAHEPVKFQAIYWCQLASTRCEPIISMDMSAGHDAMARINIAGAKPAPQNPKPKSAAALKSQIVAKPDD